MAVAERIIDRTQSEIMAERKRQRAQQLDKLRRGERVKDAVNVKIALLPGAELPQYARPGDSGFDLVAQEDYVVEPGATVLVRTGIALEIPDGYEVQVRPRSGVTLHTKLRVQLGTIDAGFRGEIGVIVDNIAQPSVSDIELNTREVVYDKSAYLERLDGSTERYGWQDRVEPTYLIRAGERIAQAVLAPVSRANFEVVAELSETERGDGGFGHSGVSDVINGGRKVIEGTDAK